MRTLAALVLLAAAVIPAAAQNDAASFPNRPIRIVVPFPAGGPTDINIRIIAQKMSENWSQGVVIENRPGANTGIGAQMVAKSAPDGYTLLAAMDTTLVMNPATGVGMTYDPFKDFAAVTLTAKNTSLLTVRASDGPKTIQELIARGKASATKLNYGAGITITRALLDQSEDDWDSVIDTNLKGCWLVATEAARRLHLPDLVRLRGAQGILVAGVVEPRNHRRLLRSLNPF